MYTIWLSLYSPLECYPYIGHWWLDAQTSLQTPVSCRASWVLRSLPYTSTPSSCSGGDTLSSLCVACKGQGKRWGQERQEYTYHHKKQFWNVVPCSYFLQSLGDVAVVILNPVSLIADNQVRTGFAKGLLDFCRKIIKIIISTWNGVTCQEDILCLMYCLSVFFSAPFSTVAPC